MKRTTIFIDEALERDLRAIAERERRPVSGLVREALGSYVAKKKKKWYRLSFVAVGRSGRSDTAEKHEELLWQDPLSAPSTPTRKRRK
jgi:predicted transcriptional regulator